MKKNGFKKYFWGDRVNLKIILSFWTVLTIFVFFVDFFSENQFDSSASIIGIIYLAILSIYAGEKEYDRWKSQFSSKFIGELFVVMWTLIMAFFVIVATMSANTYKIPNDFAIVYTTVIGIFAVTQHSKNLKSQRKK